MALTLDELRAAESRGARAVPLHEVLEGRVVSRADEVLVRVPRWRGNRFMELLAWLVASRLASPGASVTWTAEKRGGATGLRRMLAEGGWRFEESKAGRDREFRAELPREPPARPSPRSFTADLGKVVVLSFAADWGVFSRRELDEGTRLLYERAVAVGRGGTILDVGTGCGVLAVGLVASGAGERAIATDVDSVAVSLARDNARRARVPVEVAFTDDPDRVGAADLVVCNIPTHASPSDTELIVGSLARRVARSSVLVVVHGRLVKRYDKLFRRHGVRAAVVAREEHAVLRLE